MRHNLQELMLFENLQESAPLPKNAEPPLPPPIEDAAGWNADFEILIDLIGRKAAWKVAEEFAGTSIYFPKRIIIERTYYEIRQKFKGGMTYREIAKEFGYAECHVRRIIHWK